MQQLITYQIICCRAQKSKYLLFSMKNTYKLTLFIHFSEKSYFFVKNSCEIHIEYVTLHSEFTTQTQNKV